MHLFIWILLGALYEQVYTVKVVGSVKNKSIDPTYIVLT